MAKMLSSYDACSVWLLKFVEIVKKWHKTCSRTASGQCMWLACDMHDTCNHMQVSLLSCRGITSSHCPQTSSKLSMHDVLTPNLLKNLSNFAKNGACTLITLRRGVERCHSRSAIRTWISFDAQSPLDLLRWLACRKKLTSFVWN